MLKAWLSEHIKRPQSDFADVLYSLHLVEFLPLCAHCRITPMHSQVCVNWVCFIFQEITPSTLLQTSQHTRSCSSMNAYSQNYVFTEPHFSKMKEALSNHQGKEKKETHMAAPFPFLMYSSSPPVLPSYFQISGMPYLEKWSLRDSLEKGDLEYKKMQFPRSDIISLFLNFLSCERKN